MVRFRSRSRIKDSKISYVGMEDDGGEDTL